MFRLTKKDKDVSQSTPTLTRGGTAAQSLDIVRDPSRDRDTSNSSSGQQQATLYRSDPNIQLYTQAITATTTSPTENPVTRKSRESSFNNPGAVTATPSFTAAQAKWWVLGKTVGLGQQDILNVINSNAALANTTNNKSSSSGNNTASLNGMDVAYLPGYAGSDSPSWRELRSRVLPLFNGEGLKGSIEELNDAVVDWLNESTLRSSSIRQDVIELATSGVLILNKRMVISGEETLLPRVLDLWSFFFGTIVPYVQGVFVPIRERFRDLGGSSVGLGGSGNSVLAKGESAAVVDVRAVCIVAFRDQIVIPLAERIEGLLPRFFLELPEKKFIDISSRSIQMFSILQSVRATTPSKIGMAPPDEKARKCQELLQLMRDCVKLHNESGKKMAKIKEKEAAAARAASLDMSRSASGSMDVVRGASLDSARG